jgi:hypothetical protein
VAAFYASTVIAFTSGCASGGFHLTREYAGFVNKQMIILRIILYIFTSVVFVATLLIDMIIFNTMDFWDGRVSAGDYSFSKGNKTYLAHHEILPGTLLKRSTLRVMDKDGKLLQQVVLSETTSHEIEMYVDGKLRTRVKDLAGLPVASIFDERGKLLFYHAIPMVGADTTRLLAVQ